METAAFHTLLKRYGMFFVGLVIMSFGIACSIKAELGTSPVSSLPFVLSQFTPLSVGIASVLVNATLILLQILLLRRQYDPIQLIQLPGSPGLRFSYRFQRLGAAGHHLFLVSHPVDAVHMRHFAGGNRREL